MKYKLVCVDMDGTLLNKRRKISEETKRVLQKAHDLGVHIVITTGRVFNNAAYYSNLIGVKSPVIAANGAIIREKDKDEIIYKKDLDRNICLEIFKIAKKHNVTPHYHTMENIFVGNRIHKFFVNLLIAKPLPKEHEVAVTYIGSMNQWEEIFKTHGGDIVKCIIVHQSVSRLKKVREELEKIKNVEVVSSNKYNIEVIAKGVSKGGAVEALAKYYGLKREEVICIGDNENDLSMIKYAGLGVAMGNSIDIVKKNADYITDSNDKDGVAKVIKKFILNEG
ncbi:haloacid dehalogenase [Clostridium polyendosporum]|uniref:Haloacid dehalogenase n=1 Tax=Clostridium polyendosporum TaxID=69208 RepID=A0A919VGK2_9CLOT|nr:Cof-type HAD-IIB family hydrolase [Clostridium polyendosporum]GIM29475.1 haloacid dehalogenase [Clostridium polyendosporum]